MVRKRSDIIPLKKNIFLKRCQQPTVQERLCFADLSFKCLQDFKNGNIYNSSLHIDLFFDQENFIEIKNLFQFQTDNIKQYIQICDIS